MSDVYVSLDLEMTSARPESQEVIEIGAVKFRGDRVLETWNRLVRPKGSVPYNIQVLTGIKPADLARAQSLDELAPTLVEFVGRHPLVAHSVATDVGCLRRQGVSLENAQIDTFELASVLLPQLPAYGLAALAEHFGIPFPNQHRSIPDALATRAVFLRLVERIHALDLHVLQEINRLVARFDWPLKEVFRKVEAAKPRPSAFGTSIRQQLAAKREGDDLPLEYLLLTPPDPTRLAEASDGDGSLGGNLTDPEPSPAARATTEAVSAAFADGEHLLIEAPVERNRAIAYLLPAVENAAALGEPVVVAASSYQTLEQLWRVELPRLQRRRPAPISAALLKPRGSYLCFTRWGALRHRQGLALAEALTLVKTLVWLPTTETGDVAELNLNDAEREIWARISADDECEPETCDYRQRGLCFLGRAVDRAAAADVVLVSQSLLVADLVASRPVVPDHRFLVVDEAHRLEDDATLALSRHLTSRALLAHLGALADQPGIATELEQRFPAATAPGRRSVGLAPERRRELEGLAAVAADRAGAARAAATSFLDALAPVFRDGTTDHRGYEQRLRVSRSIRSRPAWTKVASLSTTLVEALGRSSESIEALIAAVEGAPLRDGHALLGELRSHLAFEAQTVEFLAEAVGAADSGRVYWLSLGAEGEVGIHSAPIHPGDTLADYLFAPRASAVLTSSTLAVGPSFGYVRRRVGLSEAREIVVTPPSEMLGSRLLYLPSDVPEPDQPAYQDRFAHALADLALATGGRTLVLFSSHSQLRQTWKAVHERLAKAGILALGQGIDGSPRRQLAQTFRTNPRTVFLATGSFWEHLDVAGSQLQVLVIPRLPFAHAADPVTAARSEGVRDPLADFTLPQTILRLRQGLDRLAEAGPDRSAVVVFDRRLQTKSYGQQILGALPVGTTRSGSTAELAGVVTDWLGIRAGLTPHPR